MFMPMKFYIGNKNNPHVTIVVSFVSADTLRRQMVLNLCMYISSPVSTTPENLGNSYLGIDAYQGGSLQKKSFVAPSAGHGYSTTACKVDVTVNYDKKGTALQVPIIWMWNAKLPVFLTKSGVIHVDLPPMKLTSVPEVYPSFCPVGKSVTIQVDPINPAYTHKFSYRFGKTQGTLDSGKSNSFTWTVPKGFLQEMPNSTQQECVISCTTYDGSVSLGTKECTFTVQLGDDMKPHADAGWFSISPYNPQGAAWNIYISSVSRVQGKVDRNKIHLTPGSSIKSIQMLVDGKWYDSPYRSDILPNANPRKIAMRVTDSRGMQITDYIQVVPFVYESPTLANAFCRRSAKDGTEDGSGTWLSVGFTPVYSDLAGRNSIVVTLKLYTPKGTLLKSQTVARPGPCMSGLDGMQSYQAVLEIKDSLGSSNSITFLIPAQTVAFQIRDGGKGAAFGGQATQNDCLDIKWNHLKVGGAELMDFPIEVGTSGNWVYKKYRSGYAECWGSVSGTIAVDQPWGAVYCTAHTIYGVYPITFIAPPMVVASPECIKNADFWMGTFLAASTVNKTPGYSLICTRSNTVAYKITFHCLGRWK